jgi:hypothetical protein
MGVASSVAGVGVEAGAGTAVDSVTSASDQWKGLE